MVPSSIVHTYTPSNPYEAHLVALFASTSEIPMRFEAIKPALELAVEDVKVKFPAINIHLTIRRDDRPCDKNYAASFAAEEYYKNKYSQVSRVPGNTSSKLYGTLSPQDLRPVSAFIGPACSLALDYVARLASFWNVPIFTAGGIGVEFSNKQLYSTLTRLSFSLGNYKHVFSSSSRPPCLSRCTFTCRYCFRHSTLVSFFLAALPSNSFSCLLFILLDSLDNYSARTLEQTSPKAFLVVA